MKIGFAFSVLICLILSACGITEIGNPKAGGEDQCVVVSKRSIGWTEVGSFGISPESAFSEVSGTCQAPFKWDGEGWNDGTLVVEPASGETTIDVTITVDQESAMLVVRETPKGGGEMSPCPSLLQISARIILATDDGAINEERTVVVTYTDTRKYSLPTEGPTISWNEKVHELDGTLTIKIIKAHTQASLKFRVMPIGIDCAGQISLSAITTTGKSGSGTDQGNFASWSISDCEFGERAIDLSEPYQGTLLLEEIAALFTNTVYQGAWNSGETTSLTLTVAPTSSKACVEPHGDYSTIVIPIQTTSATADGRIKELKADGTVRASGQKDQPLSQIELSSNVKKECRSFENLSYWSVDCAKVGRIEAQLHFNHYSDNSSDDLGTLELYPDFIPQKYLDSKGGYIGDPIPRLKY
jgi:hypothetical protein